MPNSTSTKSDEAELPVRDWMAEISPAALVLEPDTYDAALLGVVERINMEPVACYDYEKLVQAVQAEGAASRQDAQDHIDHNIAGSSMGEFTPVILHRPM